MLPIQYHLEVYEESFINDPGYSAECSMPLPSMSVGDTFDHRLSDMWENPPATGKEKFKIKEINHMYWTIEDKFIGYKAMICLEVIPV